MQNDEELIMQIKQGNKDSFEILVCRYRAAGIRFAYTIVRQAENAEDIVQDCFVKVYIYRHDLDEKWNFKSYLFTMIRNRCIDMLRKQEREKRLESQIAHKREYLPEELLLENEESKRIFRDIQSLKKNYKEAIYLYAVENLSYEAAAKIMGKTQMQVKNYIHRGRKKLRQIREGEFADEK